MYWQCPMPGNTQDSQWRKRRWVFTWDDHLQFNSRNQSCSSPSETRLCGCSFPQVPQPTANLRVTGSLGLKTVVTGNKDCLKWCQEELWYFKFECNTHHSMCYVKICVLWGSTTEKGGGSSEREELCTASGSDTSILPPRSQAWTSQRSSPGSLPSSRGQGYV